MIDAKPTTAEAPATQALALPCTGQALRQALQRRDLRALDELTRHLRVAGYRFDPLGLATDLLQNGCGWVRDAFGHRVPVHVKVPARSTPLEPRDSSASFMLAL
ncbi:hypothetical protein AACH06_26675 [Ideonella sp. DXS29W]|uniref:Uncharacterized protein n=1 Tax=Ideonella lacteola TaxID=2984193 RepID=A0ABU9BXE7_9BURK